MLDLQNLWMEVWAWGFRGTNFWSDVLPKPRAWFWWHSCTRLIANSWPRWTMSFITLDSRTSFEHYVQTSQQIGVHEASLHFTCARNIVFQHKINFCVDVQLMVCFPYVWLCFICVSFEFALGLVVFTLSLRCYRAHGGLIMVSNLHIVNTKLPEHMSLLAPICWVMTT